MIPLYRPFLPAKSIEYANEAIQSNWISWLGKYASMAAEKLAEIVDSKFCILTNNGTSATHLVVKSLKKKYPDINKIYVPSACYVAAYNSLLYDKIGWEIEAVDLSEETWNADYSSIQPEKNSALMVVHNLGNIVDVLKLKEKFNIPIIEDNCEGFFGEYRGHPSGSKSLASSLSFFGNKNITTGEGGAFFTNDESIYSYSTKIKGQGQTSVRYIHDELGYNYRMTNVQAALLLGQLEEIEFIKQNKKRIFNYYRENLSQIKGVSNQAIEPNTSHSMWMIGARFHPEKFNVSNLEQELENNGIETRKMFYPYTAHKHLKFKGVTDIASLINSQVLLLPSYPELKNLEIDLICSIISDHSK
tara:strand:+ start:3212 stop:4291 length:1080 start_codon:yes stop_codon:yes gene_type:complete